MLCVHRRMCKTLNVRNQLRRPNLTYFEGFVKFHEELTEIGRFEETVMYKQTNKQTDKWANGQFPNLYQDVFKNVHKSIVMYKNIEKFTDVYRKEQKYGNV